MEYAASKERKIKFSYYKDDAKDHEIFKFAESKIPKKPRNSHKDKESSSPISIQNKVKERVAKKIVPKTQNPPVKPQEKIITKEEKLKDALDVSIALNEENKIFAGIPEKITESEFSLKFGEDFADICEQKEVVIKVSLQAENITISFENLTCVPETEEELTKILTDLLQKKVAEWKKEQDLLAVKREQEKREEAYSREMNNFNKWRENFNDKIPKKFFDNSKKIKKVLELADDIESSMGNEIIEEFFKYSVLISKVKKAESREILSKLEGAGIKINESEEGLKFKKPNIVLAGKIKIKDGVEYEFKSFFDINKKTTKLEINAPKVIEDKLRLIFKNIYFKLIWEVIENYSNDRNYKTISLDNIFKIFEKKLCEEKENKLYGALGKNEDFKKKKLKALSKQIDAGNKYLVLSDGSIKKSYAGCLEDDNVMEVILYRDAIMSNDESDSDEVKGEDKRRAIFNVKSFEKFREFLDENEKNVKYLLKRMKVTMENFAKFEYDFNRYETIDKVPFKNKEIVEAIYETVIEFFGDNWREFKNRSTDELKKYVISPRATRVISLVESFLEKVEERNIYLTYRTANKISREDLEDEFNSYLKDNKKNIKKSVDNV